MTGLRTGELAAAAGVNRATLRYYERRGLLTRPGRTLGGHRVYPAGTVAAVRAIKTAQRLGFTLDEVADLLGIGTRRPAALAPRVAAKLAEVESRIADLTAVADTLRAAQAAGCDELADCATNPRCPLEPVRA